MILGVCLVVKQNREGKVSEIRNFCEEKEYNRKG